MMVTFLHAPAAVVTARKRSASVGRFAFGCIVIVTYRVFEKFTSVLKER